MHLYRLLLFVFLEVNTALYIIIITIIVLLLLP